MIVNMRHLKTIGPIEIWAEIPYLGTDLWINPDTLQGATSAEIQAAISWAKENELAYDYLAHGLTYIYGEVVNGCGRYRPGALEILGSLVSSPLFARMLLAGERMAILQMLDEVRAGARLCSVPHLSEPNPESSDEKQNPPPRPGYVYVVEGGGYYKIGMTSHVDNRLAQIKPALPFEVTIAHTIKTDDMAGLEARFHKYFAKQRCNGEWFQLSKDDVEWLKSF